MTFYLIPKHGAVILYSNQFCSIAFEFYHDVFLQRFRKLINTYHTYPGIELSTDTDYSKWYRITSYAYHILLTESTYVQSIIPIAATSFTVDLYFTR